MENHSESLYQKPDAYRSVFGERDDEEIQFYSELISPESRVLSLGCGDGSLEKILAENLKLKITGIDASEKMIEAARFQLPDHNFRQMTFQEFDPSEFVHPFDIIISPLLSLNYLCEEKDWSLFLKKLKSVSHPQTEMFFEILISEKPSGFQGLIETGENHEFRFYDIIRNGEFFSELMTELVITKDGNQISRKAPLAIFKPEAFSKFMKLHGFQTGSWYALHDLSSAREKPPPDARRGLIGIKPD